MTNKDLIIKEPTPPISNDNKIKVTSLPTGREDLVLMNCIFHNKKDFNGKNEIFLKLNNMVIYKSIHRNDVDDKTIEMSQILRRLLKITIRNPVVEFTEETPIINTIKKIKLRIGILREIKEIERKGIYEIRKINLRVHSQ